ncbi:MAG: carbamoyltransferase [Alphaproteobacteria bacterium]|nr:carbamoyltransferase [Alphaproteobacteria bacterium]
MVILGLSAFYHDSAAALLVDGKLVAAAQEERFTRIKHDPDYPRRAIDACLRTAGLAPSAVDMVAFYEKPLLKFDRVLNTTMAIAPRGLKRWNDALPSWFLEKLRVEDVVREQLGFEGPFLFAGHHESHAASAFFLSPFREAATLTTDGVGEWTTNAIGLGRDARLELLEEIRFPHSMGLLYSAFTQYLGFKVNNGEYKVMGLAPYGQPRFADVILAHLLHLEPDGSYRLNLDYFAFLEGQSTIGPGFADLFGGPARTPEGEVTQRHMDVARSIQAVTEQVVLTQARYVRERTGASQLCMAGGVALNSVANGKLVAERVFDDVWIQPAAGDAGGAIGAAVVAWHHLLGKPREVVTPDGMQGAYLGPDVHDADVAAALEATGLTAEHLPDEAVLLDRVAALLDEGKVIGWYQGRMEFGPRALGARSILADPRRVDMQPRVNAKIKFREGFRPFAPAVPEEVARDWFDLSSDSPYMLLVVPVSEAHRKPVSADDAAKTGLDLLWVDRSTMPAITHVDFSARVQTVSAATNPRFHALLQAFGARTGCPVLLNTSFNLRGEPIVGSPENACHTFLASGMDALVLGDHLVLRPPDRAPTGQVPPPPVFPREVTTQHLRTFGLGGAAILGTVCLLSIWREHLPWAAVTGSLAVFLGVPGALAPDSLRPVEAVFLRFGRVIGHFNARVLLTLVYLLIATPIGLLRRLTGDPLADDRPSTSGHWKPLSNLPDDKERYERMF